MLRNPPCKLDEGQNSASTCDKCPVDGAENGCVHIQIDLGRTSVLSDRRSCRLKVFETEASPAIFTPETLNFVMDYTFSYVGGDRTNRGVPREVVFCNQLGARLHFRFEDGESLATMVAASTAISTERLQMVDAEWDGVAVLRHGHHGKIRGSGLVHGRAGAGGHCGGFWD